MASSQSRKLRRAAAHLQRKFDRKAAAASSIVPANNTPGISQSRLEANRANSLLSTGPKLPETKAISAQNHTIHGLARHKTAGGASAPFKLLESEDPAGFEALKASLIAEHAPATETESILVTAMAESHWLSVRAQRLQDTCMDPTSGSITDPKAFGLYLRYQTTHTRAFHKSLNDLLKLRAEKHKVQIGFEAQRLESAQLEMKKATHELNILLKDVTAQRELAKYTVEILRARQEFTGFEAEFEAARQKLPAGKAA